jgi:excisionase family DNA binding protein
LAGLQSPKKRQRRFYRLPRDSAPDAREPRVLLKLNRFCKKMDIHEATARRWIAAGVVKAVKIRGQFRIPESEAERLARHGGRA